MRLLDLFSGAGGCSVGYARAGFDPLGVDSDPAAIRRYPFPGVVGDAMEWVTDPERLDDFDVVHASPPCQSYSAGTRGTADRRGRYSGNLLDDTLAALVEWGERTGRPWVVENVPGSDAHLAPAPWVVELCGAHRRAFDPASGRTLRLRRHRLFATNVPMLSPLPCSCDATPIGGVYGAGANSVEAAAIRGGGYTPPIAVQRALIGAEHMTGRQAQQAIPPDYTEAIGRLLVEHLVGRPT